jgi:GNAT superfamily N-acetyltransferase
MTSAKIIDHRSSDMTDHAVRGHAAVDIQPLAPERRQDASDLFESNSTTRGCWCMWFVLTTREARDGWGSANRARFSDLAALNDPPGGLLAYLDRTPVGWCAMGPRSRYPTAAGSRLMAHRDAAEDDDVWFVPCFFVRVGWRRAGITEQLLRAAVGYASSHGAAAIEGFPLSGDGPHKTDRYLGTEPLFAACGFRAVARPTARRVVMRRDLPA